jgi:glycerate kinase
VIFNVLSLFKTFCGKAPVGVANLAKKYGKPVLAFAGCVAPDARACNNGGIDAYFPILRGVVSLQEAMEHSNAESNMIATVEQVFRLIKTMQTTR